MCCWFVFIAPPFSFSCDRYGTSRKKGEKTVNPFFYFLCCKLCYLSDVLLNSRTSKIQKYTFSQTLNIFAH